MAMNFFKNCVTTFSSRISVGKKPDGNGIHRKNCGRIFFFISKKPRWPWNSSRIAEEILLWKAVRLPLAISLEIPNISYDSYKTINISRKEILSASDNGILFLKLFWPTVRKNCSSDREKLLKFKAEGWEFSKFLSGGFSYILHITTNGVYAKTW